MTNISIGALDHRLVLEAPSRTSDGGGGAVLTWSTVVEVWATLVPISGSEGLDADGVKGRVTHEIAIRYRSGVTPQMRFRLGTRIFDIRSVLDAREAQRYLKCLAEERVPS